MVCSGFAEDVQAEVAPGLGPFVVLFSQHGADETDQRFAVGEDADHVGAAADLFVGPFLGVVGPDLAPYGFGEAGERQDVGPGGIYRLGDGGQFEPPRV